MILAALGLAIPFALLFIAPPLVQRYRARRRERKAMEFILFLQQGRD